MPGASDHVQGRPGGHARGHDRPRRCVLRAGSGGTAAHQGWPSAARTARFYQTLESGYPNSAYRFWIGVFAPAKTPRDIVNKLNTEIQKALQAPAVREKLAKLGVQPMAMNAGEFDKFVNEELAINADLAKAAGISAH
ncbi:MAG: tripartite tricarboxylate transporter substrate-binding protein [Hyphomicrobiales bacterium]